VTLLSDFSFPLPAIDSPYRPAAIGQSLWSWPGLGLLYRHPIPYHKVYRNKPLMVMRENSGRRMTLRFNEKAGKIEPDAIFRIEVMTEY